MRPFSVASAFPILIVRNTGRSIAFYRDLLGFDLDYHWPETAPFAFATVRRGGSEIGLGVAGGPDSADPPAPDRPQPPVSLSLAVDDVDAAVAWLSDRGIPILAPPADQPWGERLAWIADPDGYRVMLYAPLSR